MEYYKDFKGKNKEELQKLMAEAQAAFEKIHKGAQTNDKLARVAQDEYAKIKALELLLK
jgi:uncharacterized lipoprotein YehR (DUF1307 family)